MWYDDADLVGVVSRTAAPGLPDRKCAGAAKRCACGRDPGGKLRT